MTDRQAVLHVLQVLWTQIRRARQDLTMWNLGGIVSGLGVVTSLRAMRISSLRTFVWR